MSMSLTDFVGKEVQLYPSDTDWKYGIIEEISDRGYLIRITRASDRQKTFAEGQIHFISHNNLFSFRK